MFQHNSNQVMEEDAKQKRKQNEVLQRAACSVQYAASRDMQRAKCSGSWHTACNMQRAVICSGSCNTACNMQRAVTYSVQYAASRYIAACKVQRAICSLQCATCSMQHAPCSFQYAACNVLRGKTIVQHASYDTQNLFTIFWRNFLKISLVVKMLTGDET